MNNFDSLAIQRETNQSLWNLQQLILFYNIKKKLNRKAFS